ncbi:MAG: hypothetical protein Q9164_007612, partial [Protoblastenia rupestris]
MEGSGMASTPMVAGTNLRKSFKKAHDDEVEACDEDLTQKKKSRRQIGKEKIQRRWVEKDTTKNAMSGSEYDVQFHFAVDASEATVD